MNTVSKLVRANPSSLVALALKIEDKAVRVLMDVLYEKSTREQQHSHRVCQLCYALAEELGFGEEQKIELGKIGLLHDIGKISIATELLNKPASLLVEEWQEMQLHPENGYRFLSAVTGMATVAEAVFAHHERWDGTGYPRGLKGPHIPLEARIVAVADAYDAMVSARPYRLALSPEKAIEELKNGAKKQFDAQVIDAFLHMLERKIA